MSSYTAKVKIGVSILVNEYPALFGLDILKAIEEIRNVAIYHSAAKYENAEEDIIYADLYRGFQVTLQNFNTVARTMMASKNHAVEIYINAYDAIRKVANCDIQTAKDWLLSHSEAEVAELPEQIMAVYTKLDDFDLNPEEMQKYFQIHLSDLSVLLSARTRSDLDKIIPMGPLGDIHEVEHAHVNNEGVLEYHLPTTQRVTTQLIPAVLPAASLISEENLWAAGLVVLGLAVGGSALYRAGFFSSRKQTASTNDNKTEEHHSRRHRLINGQEEELLESGRLNHSPEAKAKMH
jgi:hypothetical protein